eukprot:3994960-Pyramimonas_sp.AAC.1
MPNRVWLSAIHTNRADRIAPTVQLAGGAITTCENLSKILLVNMAELDAVESLSGRFAPKSTTPNSLALGSHKIDSEAPHSIRQ